MDNHRIGYKSYWLAYFDLLGFENRVEVMPAVYPILEEYQTALTEIRKNPQEMEVVPLSVGGAVATPR